MPMDYKKIPDNDTIKDAFYKADYVINSHEKIMVSISGGSDSDIMLDLIEQVKKPGVKITYVFFYTGLEYEATKRHIKELEEKYGIRIQTINAVIPIPKCARDYGQPFINKRVSDYMSRLQKHGFQWEDEPFDVLYERYPKCKSALWWWCGCGTMVTSIDRNKFLKEFIIANPPTFKISYQCCHYAKKLPAERYAKEHDYDLTVSGVRRSEGGVRSSAFKTCYDAGFGGPGQYRPLFWFTNEDKQQYKEYYGIVNSDCYEVWGMTRTGCAGCPFARDFEQELALADQYEPKFGTAARAVFSDSYAYTNEYKEFRRKKEQEYDKK